MIEKATETYAHLDADFINSKNSVCSAILNVIIKNAFRKTHLKQIGRDPWFFDYEDPIQDDNLRAMKLQVLRGYKASIFITEVGVTVCVDTLFRFMSTITCLDKIYELKRQSNSDKEFMAKIETEIKGSSVVADWGHKRTYVIDDVDFTTNPVK